MGHLASLDQKVTVEMQANPEHLDCPEELEDPDHEDSPDPQVLLGSLAHLEHLDSLAELEDQDKLDHLDLPDSKDLLEHLETVEHQVFNNTNSLFVLIYSIHKHYHNMKKFNKI